MLMEVEVLAGGNSPIDLNRVFDLLNDPKPIRRVFTTDPLGDDLWCEVIGWSEAGPCPAMVALAEDSGEGSVLLVYGGDQGIRLTPVGKLSEWNLDNPQQWGEPCLMLGAATPIEE